MESHPDDALTHSEELRDLRILETDDGMEGHDIPMFLTERRERTTHERDLLIRNGSRSDGASIRNRWRFVDRHIPHALGACGVVVDDASTRDLEEHRTMGTNGLLGTTTVLEELAQRLGDDIHRFIDLRHSHEHVPLEDHSIRPEERIEIERLRWMSALAVHDR